MDVEQAFDQSLKRVCERRVEKADFFESFYGRFTGASPDVAQRFRSTDMDRQHLMLKKSLYHLLTFYLSSDSDYYLDSVAVSHNRLNLDIRPDLYDLWLESLIETVRTFDDQFDERVELAWRLVMAPGIVYMKFHYDRAGPLGVRQCGQPGPKGSFLL